jgi:D-aminopeptidase
MSNPRLRDLGVTIGSHPTGRYNAITDVPGILVGHATLIADEPRVARTGVTVIMPRDGAIWRNPAFAGYHSFNGCGEMTGLLWLEESGQLSHPIALTNTHHVGTVHEAILAHGQEQGHTKDSSLPVVAETWDGWLNDMDGFHIRRKHVEQAISALDSGPMAEGGVGGGTGMICHEFKGGIGTSSRVVETKGGTFTIGALVQANHGAREDFRVDGVPAGRLLSTPKPWDEPAGSSSIIIIVATDAPLLPFQCRRLAKRATVGFARVGGIGHNGSGDIFLAFATGNDILPVGGARDLTMLPNDQMSPLFAGAADAVEESILNAVVAAETMTGYKGHTAYGLPVDELAQLMARQKSLR